MNALLPAAQHEFALGGHVWAAGAEPFLAKGKGDTVGILLRESTLALRMLRQGHGAVVVGAVRKRLQHYESRALGLRRDLSQSFECPAAKVAITVRPLQGHEGRLLAAAQVSGPESYEQLSRFQLFESGWGRVMQPPLRTGGSVTFNGWSAHKRMTNWTRNSMALFRCLRPMRPSLKAPTRSRSSVV